MPTNFCPKTCSQLSVSAILISVGIVQLLAGIILLKSDDVYLLAGTDFVVSVSNILIGSLLGIAASVWEKKKKVPSLKSTARQNVLAGLYIAALSMNATAAIIMILGDGNKLLTSKNNKSSSGDIVFEVLACAYVTSVCSPIVCLVIALVCLSGNRIRIYENMKKKNSITKKESYGWVFENNPDGQSRNFGTLLQDSPVRSASVSDDNVFLDKKSATKKLLKLKPSKNTKARNSFTSLSELKSPLEVWAHKRKKILQEIYSPNPIFFADDYLQFPDHKYDSYIGTIIPRITQTSFIRTSSGNSTQTGQTFNSENTEHKMTKIGKTMSCKPPKPHLDELNLKLASRQLSYPDSVYFNGEIDCSEEKSALPKTSFEDGRKSFDEQDSKTSISSHSMLHRTPENSVEATEANGLKRGSQTECFDFETKESPRLLSQSGDMFDNRSSIDWFQDPYNLRQNSNDSGSSGLTAETISELKAKINKINLDENEKPEPKAEFLKSFKYDGKRKSNLSESDIEEKRSSFQKLHAQYGVFSKNSENDSEIALAGEVVPISIRPTTINRAHSIPLKQICSEAPSRYSVNVKNKASDQSPNTILYTIDTNTGSTELFVPSRSQSSRGVDSFPSNHREKSTSKSDVESNNSIKKSERKFDFRQRMPFMGSITESPTEELFQSHQHLPESEKTNCELSNSPSEEKNERDPPKNKVEQRRNTFSLKRLSSKAAPNLLNRLWSMKRSELKTDLTSLIMDSDSLVGLSDDELLDRTRRLRQLRKSVELRSKVESQDVV